MHAERMTSNETASRRDLTDSTVVSYDRFLERSAWRAKVAADLEALAATPDPETPAPGTSDATCSTGAPSQIDLAQRILRLADVRPRRS